MKKRMIAAAAAAMLLCGCGNTNAEKKVTSPAADSTAETAAVSAEDESPSEDTESSSESAAESTDGSSADGDGSTAETTTTATAATTTAESTTAAAEQTTTTTAETTTAAPHSTSILTTTEDALARQKKDVTDRYNAALDDLQSSEKRLKQAESYKNFAETAVSQAQANYDRAVSLNFNYTADAFGFFEYIGASEALDALKTAKYASYTVQGDDGDATSLENIRQSFTYIRECNELRGDNGLDPLLVNDRLMAIAMSNLNYSASNTEHSQQFTVGENLAWSSYDKDPFQGWYYEEKNESGGHYQNIINSDYSATGFAINNTSHNSYGFAYGQVFDFEEDISGNVYTVDEFESLFAEFYNKAIEGDTAGYKKILDQAETDLENAETEYSAAQTEYANAVSVFNTAKLEYDRLN